MRRGSAVVEIDKQAQALRTADGNLMHYDHLLLATGSKPFILPVPGKELPGVVGFRDIANVETMIKATQDRRYAVVIGGGLLDSETASNT